MTAEIISVGTELLLGNILNTNAQYLSRELAALGITVRRQSTIGDNHGRLADFVNEAKQRCDLLVFTGGLGPTADDLTCIAAVCLFELLVLKLAKGPRSGQLIRILPVAAVNSGVLGTVLVERTQSFTLEQSLGFGLGSGLGYLLAVMLVTEAQNRLRSRAIPEAFRGLPVTLIYIGVLALAIYGFTGHSVIL